MRTCTGNEDTAGPAPSPFGAYLLGNPPHSGFPGARCPPAPGAGDLWPAGKALIRSASSPAMERVMRRSSAPVRPQSVCMVIPPSSFLLDERVFMSLGILKVAAVLERAGHSVEMLDLSGIKNYVEAFEAHLRQTRARGRVHHDDAAAPRRGGAGKARARDPARRAPDPRRAARDPRLLGGQARATGRAALARARGPRAHGVDLRRARLRRRRARGL